MNKLQKMNNLHNVCVIVCSQTFGSYHTIHPTNSIAILLFGNCILETIVVVILSYCTCLCN